MELFYDPTDTAQGLESSCKDWKHDYDKDFYATPTGLESSCKDWKRIYSPGLIVGRHSLESSCKDWKPVTDDTHLTLTAKLRIFL